MKYIGITGDELRIRWRQHYNDPNSAVHTALRRDGHRMTMTVLEEVTTKDHALRLEQEYIREMNTAEPHGWNRMVTSLDASKSNNFERELKKSWPDSYKMKYRTRVVGQPKFLPLFKGDWDGRRGVYQLSGFAELDVFAPLNFHVQYAIQIGVNEFEHRIMVFNRYGIHHREEFYDNRIEYEIYDWMDDHWVNTWHDLSSYELNNDFFKHKTIYQIVERMYDHGERILFRPQYSRGGF
jgi:hypothetical protein